MFNEVYILLLFLYSRQIFYEIVCLQVASVEKKLYWLRLIIG